jgi:hypothetical protein
VFSEIFCILSLMPCKRKLAVHTATIAYCKVKRNLASETQGSRAGGPGA